jgi:hypothetical protein
MSLSLALGILVSDLRGYKFLTSAHAQEVPCGEPSDFGDTVQIGDGIILGGLEANGLFVNGQLVEYGVIAGSVRVINSTIVNAYETSGVVVGSGDNPTPPPTGVVVGSGDDTPTEDGGGGGSPCVDGVVVGGGNSPSPSGVVVGSGDAPKPTGVVVGGGTVTGGLLTGDDITITDGVITGANLVLTGATIQGGSIYINAVN